METNSNFSLNGIQIDASRNIIVAQGKVTRVEPKVMVLLLRLRENIGQTLTRNQLINTVWGDGSGSDEALTQAVSKLRRALGESPSQPMLIETVPKQGYRLKLESEDCLVPSEPKALHRNPLRFLWPALIMVLLVMLYTTSNEATFQEYEIEISLD